MKQKITPLTTMVAVSLLCLFLLAVIGLPLVPQLKTTDANRVQVSFSELLANPSFKVIPEQTYEIAIPRQVEIEELTCVEGVQSHRTLLVLLERFV